MKYLILILLSLSISAGHVTAAEKSSKDTSYQVIKAESSFFKSLWGKIKRAIPQSHTTSNTSTAVIGVRGAETTESALQPHWEGDLSTDSAFRNDVKQFEDGTKLCESKAPAKGTEAFEQLLKTSSNDMLKANAMIALASCYAQQGNEAKGREYLKTFLLQYPKHPMHNEINAWLSSKK